MLAQRACSSSGLVHWLFMALPAKFNMHTPAGTLIADISSNHVLCLSQPDLKLHMSVFMRVPVHVRPAAAACKLLP
jgi:hypothetical protein